MNIFTQIHEIVFHGKGGYDYNEVYNMPIWLRNFTFNKIKEFYEAEKAAYDKANSTKTNTLIDSSGKVQSPEFAKNIKGVKYK